MQTEHLIILLAFIHWVADFIVQTDWQAKNKSKSLKALSAHVSTYGVTLAIGLAITNAITPLGSWPLFLGVNVAAHFATDFVTSKVTSRLYAKGDVHNFFVVVGLDQFIHLATFILTLGLLRA